MRDRIEEAGLLCGGTVAFYETARIVFQTRIGKQLPINVDGVQGAVFADLGYKPLKVQAKTSFGLLQGIAAHAVEEICDDWLASSDRVRVRVRRPSAPIG